MTATMNSGGLANVYARPPAVIPGTRMILLTPGDPATAPMFDALGEKVEHAGRQWEVLGFYAPTGRALGGVRAWLVDNFGITSFCNQRDLEVLMEIYHPGQWCEWLGAYYVAPDDMKWVGVTADPEDLKDDLLRLEWELRATNPTGDLPDGIEIVRHIHIDERDYEERLQFLLEQNLWMRIELEKMKWR